MTDTPVKDSQVATEEVSKSVSKNVLVFKDDNSFYELTSEEVIFPIELEDNGVPIIVPFLMDAKYRSGEVKPFLNELMPEYINADVGNTQEMTLGDDKGVVNFIDNHFREILGHDSDVTPDQQKQWLDEQAPHIKPLIFTEGYNLILPDADESRSVNLSFSVSDTRTVKNKRILWDAKSANIESVKFKHVLSKPTAVDSHNYKKSTRMIRRGKVTQVSVNFDVVENLYNRLVKSVDGFLYEGNNCEESNKDVWVGSVPLTDKVYVVNKLFSRSNLGNG